MKIFYKWIKRIFYFFGYIFLFIFCLYIILNIFTKPSNDRNWNNDQKLLSYVDIDENLITIHNIRNFSYTSPSDYEIDYYDKIFDLNKIKKVWYIVEPFSGIPGSAHTFLSFEFEDNQFVAISVEIRKEKGETYSPLKGLFNQYEIMYVVGDENDVIKLRSNYRRDLVYLYPGKTTKEKSQALFLDMTQRVNDLKQRPEFYNTIINTCTTNIVRHINKITPDKIPLLSISILFPENSDELAYKLGLIDTDLTFEKSREKFLINERAMKYADDPNFSLKIRE